MATPGPVEYVTLTGRPIVKSGLAEVSFLPDKRYQLLSYLAYHGDWLGRERVAFLFWPDTDTANSRQNLRGLLQRLRGLPFDPQVEVTPHTLRWGPRTDVSEFLTALKGDEIDAAIGAYNGPLLAGMEEEEAGEFGEWLEIERDRLHSEWRTVALRRLGECSADEHLHATRLVRRLLAADEFDEEAVRSYLITMRRLGRSREAGSLYEAFVRRLRDEMGLEPTSVTAKAFEDLRSLEPLPEPPPRTVGTSPIAKKARHLPVPMTSFVGRESELARLRELLLEPAASVLTVVGAGGVGKTRLALAAAHSVVTQFADGAVFVPLDALASIDEVPLSIAAALGVSLAGADKAAELVTVLSGMELLLILDNCEHLPQLPELIGKLLSAGSGVKLLATSRERLRLGEEQLFPLTGLTFPKENDSLEMALKSGAVELFLDRARRVRPSFSVDPRDSRSLAKLGSYTEGLPLAIELAAAWARVLPLQEIVESIGESLDLMASTTVDGIPRHASIRATFDQSWSTLSSIEQEVMRRLAVFKGAVTGAAARYVAGASPLVLATLVDKSLIRLGDDDLYHRHPLLLAFTREKLSKSPGEEETTVKRHASYYLHYLRERTDRARGPRPAEALAEIEAEKGEILAAAEAAQKRGKDAQLIAFMRLLAVDTGYLTAKGFGPRPLELLQVAAESAERGAAWEASHLLNGRLADAFGTHLGDRRKALALYTKAADHAAECGNTSRRIIYLSMSGVMAATLGEPGADAALDKVLSMAEVAGDDFCLATVLEHRAYVYGSRGDTETSRELYSHSLEVAGQLSSAQADPYEVRRLLFWSLLNLGEMELLLDRFELALETRRRALAVAVQSGNPIWTAHAELELGEMYAGAGDNLAARRHLQRAEEQYKSNHVTANMQRIESLLKSIDATFKGGGSK